MTALAADSPSSAYRAFTRRFDKIICADELAARPTSQRAWDLFMRETLAQRTLWELEALERAARVRNSIAEDHLRRTLLTLLVDHSGSMRGERMLLAASAVDVARSFLVHLGVTVEVLGFTTRSWKGGWSRRLWRLSGSPRKPGRLCDLLHIVYSDAADQPPGSPMRSLLHMLDPGLLKENVDGEAVLWASSRQDMHAHAHKAIVVISDGAPVDDSTLIENGPTFLLDHLTSVVSRLSGEKVMAQLQIGREAESPFPIQAEANTLTDIGTTLLDLLERVLTAAWREGGRASCPAREQRPLLTRPRDDPKPQRDEFLKLTQEWETARNPAKPSVEVAPHEKSVWDMVALAFKIAAVLAFLGGTMLGMAAAIFASFWGASAASMGSFVFFYAVVGAFVGFILWMIGETVARG